MAAQAETTGEVVCPECGRTFKRPSALGAHRWQAHRVAGSSPQARSRRRTAKAAGGTAAASNGTELWVSRYQGSRHGFDSGEALAVSPDGSTIYVTGESYRSPSYDYATVAYSAT